VRRKPLIDNVVSNGMEAVLVIRRLYTCFELLPKVVRHLCYCFIKPVDALSAYTCWQLYNFHNSNVYVNIQRKLSLVTSFTFQHCKWLL
jgi:hypothetical protein